MLSGIFPVVELAGLLVRRVDGRLYGRPVNVWYFSLLQRVALV